MKKNKKTTGILAAILIVLVVIVAAIIIVFSVRGKKSTESTTETIDAAGKHHVEIQVKNYGTIKVELDGDTAPITVANFLKLAQNGFYDGLTFHRIIDGFMIQVAIQKETEPAVQMRPSRANFPATVWKITFPM
mgnify:CR=1 FL=1